MFGKRAKSYTELGGFCFGENWKNVVAVIIISNSICTCSAYVVYFLAQIEYIAEFFIDSYGNHDFNHIIYVSIILYPICFLKELRGISIISTTALTCLMAGIIYVIVVDLYYLQNPPDSLVMERSTWNIWNVPQGLGILISCFEGNDVILEIQYQMAN